MSKRCPESGEIVLYLGCQECESKSCEKQSEDRITKHTSIKDSKEILQAHGCLMDNGWEIILGMLLQGCDYIIVKGYGHDCYFEKH